MFRTTVVLSFGLALCVPMAAPLDAQSLRVNGRINVSAVPGGFAVDGGGGQGAIGMWCAASQYALRFLGANNRTRIYVANGSTRSRGVFTTDPTGLTPSSVVSVGSSVHTPGANLPVGHAREFCEDYDVGGR